MLTTTTPNEPRQLRTLTPHLPQDGNAREHVLAEALFKGALVRERKRADRSNQPLALLLVTLTDTATAGDTAAVTMAVAAVTRDTDALGWFESGRTLGVIMPEIPADDYADDVDDRVRHALKIRAAMAAVDDVSIYVHAAPNAGHVDAARTVDGVLVRMQARRGASTANQIAKRVLDLAGSLALLAVLSPILLLIAALVKLKSPGPVFFRQVRVGEGMTPFTMLKFRTMHVNADSAIHHEFVTSFIKSGAQAQEAGKNGMFKIKNDPRVTAIGRILRKTSLDELPQLWNVVRGDMSLVGPRPPLQYEVDEYEPWHCRRVLEAKPGITGLWQVAGRSRTTFDEMVRLDLRYARAASLWTDVKILLATPAAVIAGKGAA